MKKYFIVILSVIVVIVSCVPKRKLLGEQKRVSNLENDSMRAHSAIADCNLKVSDLETERKKLQNAMQNLSSSAQNTIENSNTTISEQAKRLKDMQTLIQSQKNILNTLKKTIADALVNFKPDELGVELKDGKLYVSLQEKLLFKSGSAVVDPKGKEALQTLASVLNNTQNISITIEGHTDNVPVNGKYQDNWSLSTERAISIVRILTVDNKVDARNIIASGRSEFYPVADNTIQEGKAKNRRTEIILSPDISELFKLLNQ